MIRFSLTFLREWFGLVSTDTASLHTVKSTSRFMLGCILMFACMLAFVPFYPNLPVASLDPSWMLAMEQAVAQGFVFGREIVFSFGPYAALYTQTYHPATYHLTLFLSFLLGLCYGGMLLMAMRKQGNGWLWLYAVFLFLVESRDVLFFSYPLLVAFVAYKVTLPSMDTRHMAFPTRTRIVYAFAIALLGVLPIIKGSFLPLTVMAVMAGFILHWQKGKKVFAFLFILLPLLMMVALWHIAGQPITALADYFHAMFEIISGYAGAMSTFPEGWSPKMRFGIPGMIASYIIIATLVLVSILTCNANSRLHKIVITSCVGLFLLIAFKAGFVRHDDHALVSGSALILAVLALNLFGIARIPLLTVLFAVILWSLIHLFYMGISLNQSPVHRISGVMSGEPMGGQLQGAFNQRLDEIKAASTIPRLDGMTDIYPYDQAELIASGNNWESRPVLQSYSVYTPFLARINEAHLRGSRAPDNIVFRVSPIDHRFPSLEDGLSWPTLFSHYEIATTDQHYAYLKKRKVPFALRKMLMVQASHQLGKQVMLPHGAHTLFAEVDVSPTLLGRVARVFFKLTPLYISISQENGLDKTFRFIPGMAQTGFVISPLIITTEDFVRLANGQLSSLSGNAVRSMRLASEGSESILWESNYSIIIYDIEIKTESTFRQQDKPKVIPPQRHN